LNWRAFVAVALMLGLALGYAPAFSQAAPSSSTASVSFNHYYIITSYGFGVLNDSFTFKNSGSTPVQIPTLQVGLPSKIASRTLGVVLSPSDQFSVSQSQGNGSTTLTITPNQPTLNAGATSTVALKAVLNNILNYSNGVYTNAAHALILLSPSLNVNVTQLKSTIILPGGGALSPVPTGFTASLANSTSPSYTLSQASVTPLPSALYLNFTDTNQSAFTPLKVVSLVRTIVPSANAYPMVEDEFTVQNLAAYNIAQIHLYPLASGLRSVKVLPNTEPPLMNPQSVTLGSGGVLAFASTSLAAPLLPNSSISLRVSYPLPASMMAVSGNAVKVTIPYAPLIAAPVTNYAIKLAAAKGIVPIGATSVVNKTVTPFTPGNVVFSYTVSLGWVADQAVPAAALIFVVAFALFAIQKPAAKEEEGEKAVRRLSDVLKAFDEKTGLETQYMAELVSATKGSISRTEFDRMRNEVSELRARALQRLNEMKQVLGSGRQFDLLTRVAEAEKEEDRAFRDLLNLYLQYHGNRMNEETFRRLQPNYRKRVESAVNHLSDLLHQTQTEEK
jgi:hypothetical protein